MSYCSNCGKVVPDGAKFCINCGAPVNVVVEDEFIDNEEITRTVKHGELRKCPNCGEVVDSFTVECPTCGYEFRETGVSSSVERFASELAEADSDEQLITIIRSFPIPNTKEDILEFMLLASSNIEGEQSRAVFDAWQVKFEQSYQKAKIAIQDEDFDRIQKIYDATNAQIKKESRKHNVKAVGKASGKAGILAVKNLGFAAGIVLLIVAVITDWVGGNASLLELVGIIVLIASAVALGKQDTKQSEFAVGAASGAIAILLGFLLYNGSLLELGGGIVIVVVAVCYGKRALNNR